MSTRGVYTRTTTTGETRWYVRIMVDGVYQRFAPHGGFLTKKEAEQFALHAKADITRGKFFPDKYKREFRLPLSVMLEEQAQHLPLSPNSKNDRMYQRWWIDHFGALDVQLITPRTLEQAEQRLRDEQKSPQTIHHYMKFLRHRMTLALRDGAVEHTPFHKKKLAPVHNMRNRFYSEDERRKLYQQLDPEWRDAAELAGLTGLRWTEQFTLSRDRIHLQEGYIELTKTKSGRPQARLINKRAQQLIADQLARHQSQWLYPTTSGDTHIDYSNFRKRIWAPACKEAGITNAKWNDWRHTFASDLTMAGSSDRTVATLLGHTTTQMVKRYAHLADAHLRQAVETIAPRKKNK